MKHPLRLAMPLLFAVTLLAATVTLLGPATAEAKRYVCAPCGLRCDTLSFDHPGTCPQCGMALVDADSVPPPQGDRGKVGILIFDGVEIIDYTGPYEMFGDAGFDVYTVAATKDPITTAMGMVVVPKYSFADAPKPDVLLVPGGGVKHACGDAPTLRWVRDMTEQAKHTMSVCNGAFILASAGLLDGLTATTTAHLIDQLHAKFPKITVVNDRRFVDNGKIITAAGLSSGIDGALHTIARMQGEGAAAKVALDQEYDWRPNSGFARATLADMQIPDVGLDPIGKWDLVRYQGDASRWDVEVHGTSALSAADVMERVGKSLTDSGKWTRVGAATPAGATHWTFSGRDGAAWTGAVSIEAKPRAAHEYTLKLSIARAG